MISNQLGMKLGCVGALMVAVCAAAVQGQIVVPNTCVPPTSGAYTGTSFNFASSALTNVVLRGFGFCQPAPAVGSNVSFGMNVTFEADLISGGALLAHVSAPAAQLSVRFQGLSVAGTVETLSGELLQLDVSGGGLPAGVLMRESPSRASTGTTLVTTLGGGLWRIESFFDVFTDISFDAGATWSPSTGSTRITLGSLPVYAACCNPVSGSCQVMLDFACANLGLTPAVTSALCVPNPCGSPTGACCHGATCSLATGPSACGTAGLFLGANVACAPIGRSGPINACCPVDFNASGTANVQDIFDFLAAWFAGCP